MYEDFYNLKARPFQLMPDPRLLFESRDHKRALAYLLYGLERREGFVVITGDVGMGKTLLVQTLLGELRSRDLAIARVAAANLDATAILPTVASAFGLPHKSRSKLELLDDLVSRMMKARNNGALLIVDEAQTCTLEALEELRAVSNLQADGKALIQVFLVGQTDLRQTLSESRMAHLRQRIVASHHLVPLDADEVRAYILHRLTKVGWQDDPQFGDDVFARAHEWSAGVPRRINMLMDRLLLYGYLEQRHLLSVEDLNVVIAEFEDEFAGDVFVFGGGEHRSSPEAPVSDADIDALNDRLETIEKGLTNALGRKRMADLLDKHQGQAENREVFEAQMRLARLEGVIAELRGAEPSDSAERRDPVESEPQTEHAGEEDAPSPPSLADAIDAITSVKPMKAEDKRAQPSRWQLFGRRKTDGK